MITKYKKVQKKASLKKIKIRARAANKNPIIKNKVNNKKKKTRKLTSKVKKNKKTNALVKQKTKSKKLVLDAPAKKNITVPVDNKIVIEKPEKVKKSVMYFTQDTEDAIIEFNLAQDDITRNRIYETRIKHSFEKLVENIFNTFKFTYFETSPIEMQTETITHLVANISKFQAGKGKAFSYFSIVAKHYLIFHNNSNYKRFNQNVDISETPSDTTVCLQTEDKHHKDQETSEFMAMMIEYWENNVGKIFTKQRDLNIANAVIELFRSSDKIDAFNKKALYVYIREISSCKTQQITKVINKMKMYQNNITKCYLDNGILQPEKYKG